MVLQFTCNRADVEDFPNLISLHSTINQHRLAKNSFVYYGFDDAKEGYVHLKIDDKAKSCIKMKVNQVPKAYGDTMITDFIMTDKPSLYDITEVPGNDFRIDTSFSSLANSKAAEEKVKLSLKVSGENNSDRETIRSN
jgi:hypothetical protein